MPSGRLRQSMETLTGCLAMGTPASGKERTLMSMIAKSLMWRVAEYSYGLRDVQLGSTFTVMSYLNLKIKPQSHTKPHCYLWSSVPSGIDHEEQTRPAWPV
jgi:hypothetical protein